MSKAISSKASGWLFVLTLFAGFSACTVGVYKDSADTMKISMGITFVVFLGLWILSWYKPYPASIIAFILYVGLNALAIFSSQNYSLLSIGIKLFIAYGLFSAIAEARSLRR